MLAETYRILDLQQLATTTTIKISLVLLDINELRLISWRESLQK